MMQTILESGNCQKWTPTMLLLGVKVVILRFPTVKCFVKRTIEQRGTDKKDKSG